MSEELDAFGRKPLDKLPTKAATSRQRFPQRPTGIAPQAEPGNEDSFIASATSSPNAQPARLPASLPTVPLVEPIPFAPLVADPSVFDSLTRMKDESAQLHTELATVTSKLAECASQNQKLTEQRDALQRQLQAEVQGRREVLQRCGEAEAEIAALMEKNHALQEDKFTLRQRLTELESQLEIVGKNPSPVELQAEIAQLKRTCEDLTVKLQTSQRERAELFRKFHSGSGSPLPSPQTPSGSNGTRVLSAPKVTAAMQRVKATCAALRDAGDTAKLAVQLKTMAIRQALQIELEELSTIVGRQAIAAAPQEAPSSRALLEDTLAQFEVEKLKTELDQTKEEIQVLTYRLEHRSVELEVLRQKLLHAEQQQSSDHTLVAELSESRLQLEEREAEISALSRQLAACQRELASRNRRIENLEMDLLGAQTELLGERDNRKALQVNVERRLLEDQQRVSVIPVWRNLHSMFVQALGGLGIGNSLLDVPPEELAESVQELAQLAIFRMNDLSATLKARDAQLAKTVAALEKLEKEREGKENRVTQQLQSHVSQLAATERIVEELGLALQTSAGDDRLIQELKRTNQELEERCELLGRELQSERETSSHLRSIVDRPDHTDVLAARCAALDRAYQEVAWRYQELQKKTARLEQSYADMLSVVQGKAHNILAETRYMERRYDG
eukprot:TRINITY_DN8459_c0_g1_i1.p1 TRINITY_DN8459_c0_g1~~TRINITY_DN8459_c0_g1_i1.p1  ORF type:complete len:676 (-),score=130.80 TRINITY_DN8459_c0_g1_i1:38-2065(-)